MLSRVYLRQAASLASLLVSIMVSSSAHAADAWYYNQRLASPADSRAILMPYHYPQRKRSSFAQQPALQQWTWLKQQHLKGTKRSQPALKSKQKHLKGRALPFWPDLKPK